jgi:hypothetical protein
LGKKRLRAGFITDRDKEIFQFLFESKVAKVEQVYRELFPDVQMQIAKRRLQKLTSSCFLLKLGLTEGNRLKAIYSLAEKAYQGHVFKKDINDRHIQLLSEIPEHDLALVDIRQALRKRMTVKNIYTENVLRSHYEYAESEEFRDLVELRSDAVIELLLQEHRFIVPLEYEATLKAEVRNHKKLLDYYMKHSGKAVLFICGSDTILKSLCETDQKVCQGFTPKMYFARLFDVLNSSEKLTFLSSNREKRIVL